jgi:hypothetical protein
MTPKKNIITDYLDFNLSKEALDELASDKETLEKIDISQVSDKLANEFFNPGYEALLADKKEVFRQLVAEDSIINNDVIKEKKPAMLRNVILALIAAVLLGGALYLFSIYGGAGKILTKEDVKQYALLSYESTGALNANRGRLNATNQLQTNYNLLINEQCDELVITGKYVEQELWSQLYCAYLNDNQEMIDHFKNQIIEKKYSNYKSL